MSLRLQLALWYGGLTVLVLLLMSVLTYAVHARAHHDDLDNTLVGAVEHVEGKDFSLDDQNSLQDAVAEPLGAGIVVRAYGADGERLAASSDDGPGDVNPEQVLAVVDARPLSLVQRIAPSFREVDTGDGAIDLTIAQDGDKWRVYVLPIEDSSGYLAGFAPMAEIEGTVNAFRTLVVLIGVFGAGASFGLAWLLAGRALRPLATLTSAAGTIARSRRLNERVPVSNQQDEMGQLAATFNQMLESLEEANDSQRRFVGDASHELRAPLTAIQANLELLIREQDVSEEDRREMIEHANRESHRLSRVVADLLALARADAGIEIRREPVELDRTLLDALGDAQNRDDGKRIVVERVDPAVVTGDSERLSQLILILLDNAIKYTPPDGRISIELVSEATEAWIFVHDTGVGISSKDLAHVFDRFYRADPARSKDPGGTGLGLSIAQWIAREHGGSVELQSVPGTRTTAIVRLPLRQQKNSGY